jgi:hypothetical protein
VNPKTHSGEAGQPTGRHHVLEIQIGLEIRPRYRPDVDREVVGRIVNQLDAPSNTRTLGAIIP